MLKYVLYFQFCLFLAGFGHTISQLRVKREAAVYSSQFPREQQPFTGSDFDDTPERESALFR